MNRVEPRRTFLLALTLLTALGTAFHKLLGGDEIPLFRDALFYFYPLKAFLADSLRRGDLPLWNPWILLGTPVLAGLQTGVLYPPSLVLLIPFPLGWNLFLFFHYAIALLGTVLWLRDREAPAPAIAVGALTFTLGGFLVSMMNVTNNLQAVAWTPWVLYLGRWAAASPSPFGWAGLAMVIGIQTLAGSPEMAILTMLLLGVEVFPSISKAESRLRPVLRLGAGVTAGIALVSFQLLPTIELSQLSLRAAPLDYASLSYWSLEPLSLVQLFFPHSSSFVAEQDAGGLGRILERSVPWILSLYLGLLPFCLAFGGAAYLRDRRAWIFVVAIGALLALGSNAPVLGWIHAIAPGVVGKFRYPEKFYFLVHVAVVVLAAGGTQALLERHPGATRAIHATAISLLVLATGVYLLRSLSVLRFCDAIAVLRADPNQALETCALLGTDLVFKAQRLLLVAGALLGLLALYRRQAVSSSLIGLSLPLLTFGDLASVHYDLNLMVPSSEIREASEGIPLAEVRRSGLRVFAYQTYRAAPGTADPEPLAGFADVFTKTHGTQMRTQVVARWSSLIGNSPIVHRIRAYGGLDPMALESSGFLRQAVAVTPRRVAVRALRAFSVGWFFGEERLDIPDLEEIVSDADGGPRVYRLREPVPRARLVYHLRAAKSDVAAYNELIAEDFDPALEAVVTMLPPGWENAPRGNRPAGSAEITEDGSDIVVIESESSRAGFLVLADSDYPGWRALVDGKETPILRTNVMTRGLVVPSGHHIVEFRFEPDSFRLGAFLSLLAAGGVIAFVAASLRERP